MTHREVAGYGFYSCDYDSDICDKLDSLHVHMVKPREHGELDVVLLEGE